MPEPLTVVCAADERFALGLVVTLRSAVDHVGSDRRLAFTLLDGGLRPGTRRRIEQSVPEAEVRWVIPARDRLAGVKLSGHIRLPSYFRLLVPETLDPKTERALYLDADVLVEADLEPLERTDLEGCAIAAAQDMSNPFVASRFGLPNWRGLGLRPEAKYFNAGVLVIDVERWRRDRIPERVLAYIRDNPEAIRFHDQDGLNALLAGDWLELDPRWNLNAQPDLAPEAWTTAEAPPYAPPVIDDPWIVHFTSTSKPWHLGCRHPHRDRFLEVLDRTAWARWRPRPWHPAEVRRGWATLRTRVGQARRKSP